MQKNGLIIFTKNPVLDNDKANLPSSSVEGMTLQTLKHLLTHTQKISADISADKWVFYDNFIDESDSWDNAIYKKSLQLPMVDLGQKMANAFWDMIQEGYEKIIIIGIACPDLSPEIIEKAYSQLIDNQRVMIGKAENGAYYLLGINLENLEEEKTIQLLNALFLDKKWNHNQVYQEAIDTLNQINVAVGSLPTLAIHNHDFMGIL